MKHLKLVSNSDVLRIQKQILFMSFLTFHDKRVIGIDSIRISPSFCQDVSGQIDCSTKAMPKGLYLRIMFLGIRSPY